MAKSDISYGLHEVVQNRAGGKTTYKLAASGTLLPLPPSLCRIIKQGVGARGKGGREEEEHCEMDIERKVEFNTATKLDSSLVASRPTQQRMRSNIGLHPRQRRRESQRKFDCQRTRR